LPDCFITFAGMSLLENYLSGFDSPYSVFDQKTALSLYKPRDPFAHKGNFGHALLLAGSRGKIGAAVLAAKACLSSGAGLLTVHLPSCGYEIMQTSLPEAMVFVDKDPFQLTGIPPSLETYQAAGIGPGIGTSTDTTLMFKNFLKSFQKPLVLDADALNIISRSPELLRWLKPDTIITPHPKEFDRLFGSSPDDPARFGKAKKMAIQYQIIIVLKGHFTGVFKPDGHISFNTSGNAGMAKGGSGDTLTGIITALLAQSYTPDTAAVLGVYLHGYAGDLAARQFSEEAMLSTDLVQCLGKTFLEWKVARIKN
jgi:ADP-dependent NAD(P)H-hydrate dehydratase / NAD(P)H-hydrate epimerase